ncbi:MAG: EAL domain-containing protein [Ketobacter sp.]|nr:MAG: EAL domain-containing protein [Ketobacter sp.]
MEVQRQSAERKALASYKTPWFGALVALFVVLIPSLMLAQYLIEEREKEIFQETQYLANAFVTKLEGRLEANVAVGRGFKVHIEALGDLNQEELDALSARLIDGDLNIRHVALAPDLVVRSVHPLRGNEAVIGFNYMTHPVQRVTALRALQTKTITLAGPVPLVQNNKEQLIARFPVYRERGEPWGLIGLVIKYDELLKDAGLNNLKRSHLVAIRGKGGTGSNGATFLGDEALFKEQVQLHKIDVPGGTWQLSIKPRGGWSLPVMKKMLLLIAAILISVSFAYLVYVLRQNFLQRKAYLKHLKSLSAIDPLTQLPSRYQFNISLNQLVSEAQRNGVGFTVLLVNLDHFKEVNVSLSQAVGDRLLIDVSDRLRSSVRDYDLLSRLGSDEFVAVFRGIYNTSEIEERARDISTSLSAPFSIMDQEVSITCSLGVAVYPQDGSDGETLIKHADRAMHESKKSGRNTMYFFNSSMRNEADKYMELTSAMRTGLAEGHFQVYYQPILDVALQRFTRCEALCRWISPDRGFISPGEFIPVAEQSGLILELGSWLSKQVFACYHTLNSNGYDINFSLNRSPLEFNSIPHTEQFIQSRIQSGIPAEKITLEITESLLMSDNNIKSRNFNALKQEQLNFSIDDFGTGYSAINYLRKYPVESLKIDKSFISEMGVSGQADTLVKVIIQMAKTLEISVVAEGVETREQYEALKKMDCDYIQGFYFAKPMPKEDFLQFIAEHEKELEI